MNKLDALKVGRTIRKRRIGAGYTQLGLATRCLLDRSYLSDVERGKKSPTMRTLALLARGIGCRITDFLEGM